MLDQRHLRLMIDTIAKGKATEEISDVRVADNALAFTIQTNYALPYNSTKLRFVLELRTACRSWQCDQYSSWPLSSGRISS
jgi:hypothetical protein